MSAKIDYETSCRATFKKTTQRHLKYFLRKTRAQLRIIQEVKNCIDNQQDIDEVDEHGNSLLQKAAWENMPEIAELLLINGGNLNKQNENQGGNSILHEACYLKNIDVVELLLNYKVDVNLKNNNGETPLDFAISLYKDSADSEGKKVIKLLKRHEKQRLIIC